MVNFNMEYMEFESYMLTLQKNIVKERELNKHLKNLGIMQDGENFDLLDGRLIDAYINILSIAMKDDNDCIAWFIFDNDFGKKQLRAKGRKKLKKIVTLKQLYNLINEH